MRFILYHLNDSKYEIKGVDRHEIIGQGHIDIMIFMKIISTCKNKNNFYII